MKMKLLLYSMALVLSFAGQSRAAIGVADIVDSAGTIVSGLGQQVIKRIPTPAELLDLSKQIVAGLPETIVFGTIHDLCSLYMASGTIRPRITPDIESMTLKLHTPNEVLSFPLKHAEKILDSPYFNVNNTVVIFSSGWKPSLAVEYVANLADAYNCRGNYNFLSLNSSDFVDTLYTWSAYNTQAVGEALAVGMEKLGEKVAVENFHLIGHSLGAHIVGYAGRSYNEKTGLHIPRITGLDPANPCFDEGNNLSGLQRGDAVFVDIVHSNVGGLGVSYSIGDADFYPAGMTPIKPGCSQFPCSHFRAYEYFTESVYPGNEQNFLGTRCTSVKDIEVGSCQGQTYPMGFATPHNLKGNFYLPVNAQKPFGQNYNNGSAVPSECRTREHNGKTQ